jgi:hypothetical protein
MRAELYLEMVVDALVDGQTTLAVMVSTHGLITVAITDCVEGMEGIEDNEVGIANLTIEEAEIFQALLVKALDVARKAKRG